MKRIVDTKGLSSVLRVHLGEMRNKEIDNITFVVNVVGKDYVIEYRRTGQINTVGWNTVVVNSSEIHIQGNDTSDQNKLPEIALGLIISDLLHEHLIVEDKVTPEGYPYDCRSF